MTSTSRSGGLFMYCIIGYGSIINYVILLIVINQNSSCLELDVESECLTQYCKKYRVISSIYCIAAYGDIINYPSRLLVINCNYSCWVLFCYVLQLFSAFEQLSKLIISQVCFGGGQFQTVFWVIVILGSLLHHPILLSCVYKTQFIKGYLL